MHRFGVVHSLQDIVVLNPPGHSFLNLKHTGTGLGHEPVRTHTKAKRERERGGKNKREGGREGNTQTHTKLNAKTHIQKNKNRDKHNTTKKNVYVSPA